MRKIIGLVICLVLAAGVVYAGDINLRDTIDKIPNIKTGVNYSLIEKEVSYSATIDVLEKNGFTVGVGVASNNDRIEDLKEIQTLIATVSYNLVALEDLKINVPVLDLVSFEPYIWGGYNRIDVKENSSEGNNEWDYGIGIKLLSVDL